MSSSAPPHTALGPAESEAEVATDLPAPAQTGAKTTTPEPMESDDAVTARKVCMQINTGKKLEPVQLLFFTHLTASHKLLAWVYRGIALLLKGKKMYPTCMRKVGQQMYSQAHRTDLKAVLLHQLQITGPHLLKSLQWISMIVLQPRPLQVW